MSRCLITLASLRRTPGWRLWVSATGRHWALRSTILTAAQISAGAQPILWARDSAALAALIRVQQALTAREQPPRSPSPPSSASAEP